MSMDVTVLICTHDNCALLERTLDSIARCTIPPDLSWELVVVNNACSDDTDRVVDGFRERLPIVAAHEPRPGVSIARNAGLARVNGELIVFTDDDVVVCEQWIAEYWKAHRELGPRCFFGGPIESEFDGYDPDPELVSLAMSSVQGIDFGDEVREVTPQENFIGPNWASPAAGIREIGGTDETRGQVAGGKRVRVGEETDQMMKLRACGYRGIYLPSVPVLHNVPQAKCTVGHLAGRMFGYGYTMAQDNEAGFDGARVLGVPRWLIAELARRAAGYGWARLTGKRAYRERLRLAEQWGRTVGFWELRRGGR